MRLKQAFKGTLGITTIEAVHYLLSYYTSNFSGQRMAQHGMVSP